MELIAVPNVSEGRDAARIRLLIDAVRSAGATVADVHSDPRHNRSVFTVVGPSRALSEAMVALAGAARDIDLTKHEGLHPRLGGLDVCPFVPREGFMVAAVRMAQATAGAIAENWDLPVYLYGAAARRDETRELPSLRRGGLRGLKKRARAELPPDHGPVDIDDRYGVVCVGAREVLIAFNVWIASGVATARSIAAEVRTAGGGPPGVRAIGLEMNPDMAQVSMNLIAPALTGVDAAFDAVREAARRRSVEVVHTELVGLPPQRFMPDPEREAARLLLKPGRSLESALA